MDVRTLHAQHAAAYQRLFIRALNEHPEAFGVSVDEQEALPVDTLAEWFAAPVNRFYGAFNEDVLVGIATLQRYTRKKLAHRATIGGMYVAPEARGQGIGKALMEQAVRDARLWDGVEDVVLAVTVGNEAAQRLYASSGFTTYSTDPRLLKVNDCYFDIEWMICPISSTP